MIFTETINKNEEYVKIYKRGTYKVGPLLVTYAYKRNDETVKMGITTSKKIGNAVKRNRARRVLRAAYSEIESSVPKGWSFVFVARSLTTKVKSTDVAKQMKEHIESIIKKEGNSADNGIGEKKC